MELLATWIWTLKWGQVVDIFISTHLTFHPYIRKKKSIGKNRDLADIHRDRFSVPNCHPNKKGSTHNHTQICILFYHYGHNSLSKNTSSLYIIDPQ